MNPLWILAAIGGYFVVSKTGAASAYGGPIPTTGTRRPPANAGAPQGAGAGQQGGSGTAAIIGAAGGAVRDVTGAFVNLWDALSTSQDAPPDPSPAPGGFQAPAQSGGGMAGSDWYGYLGGSGPDVAAGDSTFVMGNPPA